MIFWMAVVFIACFLLHLLVYFQIWPRLLPGVSPRGVRACAALSFLIAVRHLALWRGLCVGTNGEQRPPIALESIDIGCGRWRPPFKLGSQAYTLQRAAVEGMPPPACVLTC